MADEPRISAVDLIHRVISTHHSFLRSEAPRLLREIGALPETPEGVRCRTNLEGLLRGIDDHLLKEERILFPTIEEIELSVIEGSEPRIMACGVVGPINEMLYEHVTVRESLRALSVDCAQVGTPELVEAVRRLSEDLLEHIRIEEEELFPIAGTLCPGGAV